MNERARSSFVGTNQYVHRYIQQIVGSAYWVDKRLTDWEMRSFFRSRIHRATVTHADLQYEGSLSIDRSLTDAADIAPFEEVHIWNVTRGTRLTTYAIEAPPGSGVICANGAAAHHISVGDLIIIATFQLVASPADATTPVVIQVDERNRAIGKRAEIAGPKIPADFVSV